MQFPWLPLLSYPSMKGHDVFGQNGVHLLIRLVQENEDLERGREGGREGGRGKKRKEEEGEE